MLLSKVNEMPDAKAIAKVSDELSGLLFQVGEILDDLDDVNSLGEETLRGHLEELKVLRVNVVKVSSELKLLRSEQLGEDDGSPSDTDKEVSELLKNSKAMILTLRNAIDAKQAKTNQQNYAVQQRRLADEQAGKRERRFCI